MRRFRDFPIRHKLTAVILLTSVIVLALSSTLFVVNEAVTFWRAEKGKIESLCAIVANNTAAALTFNDAKSATDTLAGLNANPYILSAYIVTRDGETFASFLPPNRDPGPSGQPVKDHRALLREAQTSSILDVRRDLIVVRPILLDGQAIGTVVIESSLGELYSRLKWLSFFTLLVMAGAIAMAYLLSSRFQAVISRPILGLARTMETVSQTKDFSVRGEKSGDDELGTLVDGFNEMLVQIQRRDADLLKTQADLEKELGERKRAEAALQDKTAELGRSNKELEQFAYVASHDLQEPLRMVTNYLQLLRRRYQGKIAQDADEFIDFAVDGAMRMRTLINDLLAYSRVGTKGKPFEPTALDRILDQSLQNLMMAIKEKSAEVTRSPLPTVMADGGQLLQLFQNLIGNAIKFHGQEPPRVHISAAPDRQGWLFSVRDNGIGIPREHAERIFVIFQRLHSREKYPGTGIGLAVCKKIVERHGGRIWAESEDGKGTTFFFTLPALNETVQTLPPPQTPGRTQPAGS
jgi:signal transduction histidine kinase